MRWLLITSISLVSLAILMFLAAHLAVLNEAILFYDVENRSSLILFVNLFNICYLIFTPILFSFMKNHYSTIVVSALMMIAVGCVGRYIAYTSYSGALISTILVAVAHVPIITAPYGLLELFTEAEQPYASSIPLFVPVLGVSFSILYGMEYIAGSTTLIQVYKSIGQLNYLIAVLGAVSVACTVLFFYLLADEIKQKCNKKDESASSSSAFQQIKKELSRGKSFFIMIIAWGMILGVNWTYGGMFQVIFSSTGMSEKDRALLGLNANISSVIFCNLGNWISNNTRISNNSIIFFLNIVGLASCLLIQTSSVIWNHFIQKVSTLSMAVILLRAGFSSFTSLALIQLQKFGMAPVLVSAIFFYVANLGNLIGNVIVDSMSNPISLAVLAITVWVCLFAVSRVQNLGHGQDYVKPSEAMTEEEMSGVQNQSIQNQ